MGPSYASLFVEYVEHQFFNQYDGPKPDFYGHYIDDCIGAISSSREKLDRFITLVNSFHPALRYTWEISETSLAFLDIKVSINGDMSRNAHNNKNGKKENMLANLANMAKMTILPQSSNRAKYKAIRGPIKVGDPGEFGKYGENDNFATIANRAKHKAIRGPIKVGDPGEFGKYGENDNFATSANRAKHKAIRGPIKVGDPGEFGKMTIFPQSPAGQSSNH